MDAVINDADCPAELLFNHFLFGQFSATSSLFHNPPDLKYCCDGKNTANDKINGFLTRVQFFYRQFAAKNKNTVRYKCSDPNAQQVTIVISFFIFQDTLVLQQRTPTEPKRNRCWAKGPHTEPQDKPVHSVGQEHVFGAMMA